MLAGGRAETRGQSGEADIGQECGACEDIRPAFFQQPVSREKKLAQASQSKIVEKDENQSRKKPCRAKNTRLET
ncbi:MAG: hypothetical protein ACJ731_12855 [Vicinamibacterales bacterium]